MKTLIERYDDSPIPLQISKQSLQDFYGRHSIEKSEQEIDKLLAEFDTNFIVKTLLQKYGDTSIIQRGKAAEAGEAAEGDDNNGGDQGEEEEEEEEETEKEKEEDKEAKKEGAADVGTAAAQEQDPAEKGDDDLAFIENDEESEDVVGQ